MAPQHIDPEQALRIHNDLKSKLSFGIHWGTFPMGSTEVCYNETNFRKRLAQHTYQKVTCL